MTGPDGVILLHGIARASGAMRKLEHALSAAGYQTLNLDYPARRHDIASLGAFVADRAGAFIGACSGAGGRTHFVTHSMGGLVALSAIRRHRPPNLGRLVMLGPPNQGSEIADRLAGLGLYRRAFGPAGQDLTTAARAADTSPADVEVGIIAGDRALDVLSWALLPKPNDGKVSVARTTLPGMTGHITVHATHTLMMRNPAVISATLAFLRTGRF